jgi:hypothetical protein
MRDWTQERRQWVRASFERQPMASENCFVVGSTRLAQRRYDRRKFARPNSYDLLASCRSAAM